ncbi:polymerase delta-interacting protein 3 [Menidia menidia]
MADVSLDEVIRRRGINLKAPAKRPVFGRTIGGDGKSFDARQKIGNNDVRQRLGGGTGFPVKDAREKLVQKDARFKIRGTVGAGAVQDARQMINSRKQGQSQLGPLAQTTLKTAIASQLQSKALVPQIQIHASNNLAGVITRQFASSGQGLGARGSVTPQLSNNVRMMDARDRLSLKRSIGGTQAHAAAAAPPLKITKTIQQRPIGMSSGIRAAAQPALNELDGAPSKQIKFTTANSMLQTRSGAVGSTFSMSAPITKVVKNDAYTAPRPPVPVAPTRPNTSMAAARSSAAALQPISRTLQQSTTEARTPAPTPPQPAFSPLEGTKITVNNLHPRVTEEDIVELFCVCGALKRARLVKVGVAEVVFVRKEDAVSAYRKYNNRCLDGQPMKCNLHIQGNVITSDQPILLRLSDTPGAGGSTKKDSLPPSLSRAPGQRASSQPTPEVDPQTILKALFKSTAQSTSTTEAPSSQTTAFRIKI